MKAAFPIMSCPVGESHSGRAFSFVCLILEGLDEIIRENIFTKCLLHVKLNPGKTGDL